MLYLKVVKSKLVEISNSIDEIRRDETSARRNFLRFQSQALVAWLFYMVKRPFGLDNKNSRRVFEMSIETRVVEKKGLRAVDLTVAALLIAVGAVIRLTIPPMFGITPNFAIAMYSLAILLIRPRLGEALGIGVVAGLVCMVSSKAAYPVNLISEPVGAVVCFIIFFLLDSKFKNFILTPLLATALATLASGLTFVGVYNVFRLAPLAAQAQMLITVATLTVLNGIITQVLYFPAKKALNK